MLNLIKYEFIKKRVSLAILYAILLILTTYVGISVLIENQYHIAVSSSFFGMVCLFTPFYLWLDNMSTYGKELKEKYSYMLYMTPNNSYKILGSKIIYIIGVTIITLGFEFLMSNILYVFVRNKFTDLPTITEILSSINIDISKGFLPFCSVIVSFLSILLLAYLCITLSNTILSNKKRSGFLTFVLFVVLNWIITFITNRIGAGTIDWTGISIVTLISSIIVIIAGYLISGYLLDKKISL